MIEYATCSNTDCSLNKPSLNKPVNKPGVKMKACVNFIVSLFLFALSSQLGAQTINDYYLENLGTTDTYIVNSFPNNVFSNDQNFITGGWGDTYISMLKFNIASLPAISPGDRVSVWFYNKRLQGNTATPTQVNVGLLASDFNNSTTWNNSGLSWYTQTVRSVNVNPYDYWTEFVITDYYNYWKSGVSNFGFAIVPVNNNNNFNFFQSSNTSTPISQKPILRITRINPNQFLSFPIGANLFPQGAYTPGKITSILDHNMDSPYTHKDGKILSFTGELFQANSSYPSGGVAACYPKAGGGVWSSLLQSLYIGTAGSGSSNCTSGVAVNYEGHPGYDYVASTGTPVRAAAAGTVVNNSGRCVPKGISAGCAAWGAVGIDHGNGYITQYMHLSSISVSAGQVVAEGQQIGLSGNTSPTFPPLSAHLHFEVLKLRTGYVNNYDPASYATVDPYGYDGSATGYSDYLGGITGIPNVRLWK